MARVWRRRCVWAAWLLVAVSQLRAASGISFDLGFGEQKCFSEDVGPRATVRGEVAVAGGRGGGDMKLDVYVTNAQGVVAFHRADVNSVKFSFTSAAFQEHSTQPYRVCVLHQVAAGARAPAAAFRRVSLRFDVARETRSVQGLATRRHADRVYQSFHDVSLDVDRLIEAMDDLRARERQLADLNSATTTTIVRISLVACLFTILTGVLNVMSLKSFFKQKKLA